MQYLALLIGPADQANAPGAPTFEEEMAAYARFDEKYGSAILGGNALEMEESPTTVRTDGDRTLVVDGPYAEAAEGVGGYYVLEAPSLDEAIEMAADLPQAELGCVELRPLVVWQDFSPAEPGPAPGGARRYVALIRGKESEADDPTSPEWEPAAQEHRAFAEAAGADLWEGLALHPVAMSTTVRTRDGEVLVTDGPYPEATEVVGGAYAFGPVTKERAIELAARIPAEAIELVPVMEVG